MTSKLAFVLIAASILPTWAQPQFRHGGHAAAVAPLKASGKQVGALHLNSRSALKKHAATPQAATPPAPGVVQIQVVEGNVFAYFIVTSTIPAGSSVGGAITIDNNSELDFDSVQFTSDSAPGDYLVLPSFSNLGDLWPTGIVTYYVDVTMNKTMSEASSQFLSGESFSYSDLTNFAPVITGTSQKIAANKDMILVINGVFTSDTPTVVLEATVAPASAITRVSGSEIDVNLSQVSGLDLTTLNEYLLTVGQGGFADTMLYRYAPAAPNTFNPAPQ
jgi:hypothetical protein